MQTENCEHTTGHGKGEQSCIMNDDDLNYHHVLEVNIDMYHRHHLANQQTTGCGKGEQSCVMNNHCLFLHLDNNHHHLVVTTSSPSS